MEILQITFRNMKSLPAAEEWIRAEVAKLETFYSQITGCHVVIEVPHRHREKGSLYHVRIDLTVHGGELVIKREANLSSRVRRGGGREISKQLEVETPHKNLRMAINDAFRAAARRLQDYARRQRGDVKNHQPGSRARIGRAVGA